MAPDKEFKAPRSETRAVHATEEIRLLRRKMKKRVHEAADVGASAAPHHDDGEPAIRTGEPPREDRAG
jgi:hypothetical protein